MTETHASLSPTTNILLAIVWGAVAFILLFVVEPHVPLNIGLFGALLGGAGGVMQHLSIAQATSGFSAASSLLDVRRALKSTSWGSRYISFLYFSKVALAVLAFLLIRRPFLSIVFAYLTEYMSFMFVRELITLRDTFHLQRISSQKIPNSTNVP